MKFLFFVALASKLKTDSQVLTLFTIPKEDHLGGYWAAAHPKAALAIEKTTSFINGLK